MNRIHIALCLVAGLLLVGACDTDAQDDESPKKDTTAQSTPDTSAIGSSSDAQLPPATESRCLNKFSMEYTPCCESDSSPNGLACDAATWVSCTPRSNLYCMCSCQSDGKVACAC